MRRLASGRAVLGVVLSAVAGVGCGGDAPGGHKPDAGGLGGLGGQTPDGGPLPDGGGPGGAAGSPAAGGRRRSRWRPVRSATRPDGAGTIRGPAATSCCPPSAPPMRTSGSRAATGPRFGSTEPDGRPCPRRWRSRTALVLLATECLGGRRSGHPLRWDLVRAGARGGRGRSRHLGVLTQRHLRRRGTYSETLRRAGLDGPFDRRQPRARQPRRRQRAGRLWIAASETLWHLDGVSFSPQPPFEDGFIGDIAVAARNDVWVASFVQATFSYVLRHFDGTTWSVAAELPVDFRVGSISATGPTTSG